MRKLSLLLPAVFCMLLLWSACEKAYLSPKRVEITEPVSFADDIIPILVADCATPTCHVGGGPPPDLTPSKAYDELTALGYVDTSNAEGSILYKLIISTTSPMPPNGSLSPEEIGYILAWIKQGAQNN
ncbi:MAG: hypothetical protein JNL88_06805 [Bacteroidia bacterium]|nr:hypothetical protein [Bacteroidia bacterium]